MYIHEQSRAEYVEREKEEYTRHVHVDTHRSSEHVVHECSKTPPVHTLTMTRLLEDLWCPVEQGLRFKSRGAV